MVVRRWFDDGSGGSSLSRSPPKQDHGYGHGHDQFDH